MLFGLAALGNRPLAFRLGTAKAFDDLIPSLGAIAASPDLDQLDFAALYHEIERAARTPPTVHVNGANIVRGGSVRHWTDSGFPGSHIHADGGC